jgi:hypothetical protein
MPTQPGEPNRCPHCDGEIVPVERILTRRERKEVIDSASEGKLRAFFEARAPWLLDDHPVTVALRELDKRMPQQRVVSTKAQDAVDQHRGRKRPKRKESTRTEV